MNRFIYSLLVLVMAVQVSEGALAYPLVPDPNKTTGELCSQQDRDFQSRKYPEKIAVCDRNVSPEVKHRIYESYGIPRACRGHYTVDHFIPLSIGGNNDNPNLWPEHRLVKRRRLYLEQDVFDAVSAGKMTQAAAVEKIRYAKTHPDAETLNLITVLAEDCDRADQASRAVLAGRTR